jgi:hypothetical protein
VTDCIVTLGNAYRSAPSNASIWVAIVTGIAALLGKLITDSWSRHRQTAAVASTIYGEIQSYVYDLRPHVTAAAHKALEVFDDTDELNARLRGFSQLPFAHPVFNAVADRLGLLPAKLCEEVATFYTVVTGVRGIMATFPTDEFAKTTQEVKWDLLIRVAESTERHIHPVAITLEWLNQIGTSSYTSYLASLFTKSSANPFRGAPRSLS